LGRLQAKNWTPPKTSWGDAAKFGARKSLTGQELADLVKKDQPLDTSAARAEERGAAAKTGGQ